MKDLVSTGILTFSTLFFTIDPIGVTPIFLALTSNLTIEQKKKVAKRGVLIASIILFFFVVTGSGLLDLMGIKLPAFRIAGGILLLLLSIEMVMAKQEASMRSDTKEEREEALQRNDVSVFPLAIPLLSGPAAITMLILFVKQAEGNALHQFIIMAALGLNMVICWLVLNYSTLITKILGKIGINVMNRIFGILLTALACQFFIDGINDAFFKHN